MSSDPRRMTRMEQLEADLRAERLLRQQYQHENRLLHSIIAEWGLRRQVRETIQAAGEWAPSLTNEDVAFLVRRGKAGSRTPTELPAATGLVAGGIRG